MAEYIENPLSGKLRGVTYEDGKIIDVHIRDTDDVVKVFVPMASEKEATGMAEYIEKDYHYSTRYALIKNGERIEFNSEQDALTVPVRKRTRGYRPSASCGAIMDGGDD